MVNKSEESEWKPKVVGFVTCQRFAEWVWICCVGRSISYPVVSRRKHESLCRGARCGAGGTGWPGCNHAHRDRTEDTGWLALPVLLVCVLPHIGSEVVEMETAQVAMCRTPTDRGSRSAGCPAKRRRDRIVGTRYCPETGAEWWVLGLVPRFSHSVDDGRLRKVSVLLGLLIWQREACQGRHVEPREELCVGLFVGCCAVSGAPAFMVRCVFHPYIPCLGRLQAIMSTSYALSHHVHTQSPKPKAQNPEP
jgi:hypothetical protein